MALRLGQLWRYCRIAFALLLQCPSATAPRQAGLSAQRRVTGRANALPASGHERHFCHRDGRNLRHAGGISRAVVHGSGFRHSTTRDLRFSELWYLANTNHLANVVANYRRGKSAVRSRVLFASLPQNLFDNRDEIGFAPCRRSLSGLHKIQREECN